MHFPTLHTSREDLDAVYAQAVDSVTRINLAADPRDSHDTLLRAGGGYAHPWTRDAAINVWNGASHLVPEAAEATLRSVTEPSAQGDVIARDAEWWDQVIWVIGAWHHWTATGSGTFLEWAHSVSARALTEYAERRDPATGLFRGGAVMQDGIAGYPAPPAELDNPSPAAVDHTGVRDLACLSTNLIYAQAYSCLADMAAALGAEDARWRALGLAHARSTVRHLATDDSPRLGYFLSADSVDPHQEALGLALAVETGAVPTSLGKQLLEEAHVEPWGVTAVWPHFERFSTEMPGRHNGMVWPMIQGFWATAWATLRDRRGFADSLDQLTRILRSEGGHWEVYRSDDGEPDGGWQSGVHWRSEPDQTWSSTALIRAVHRGIFGLAPLPDALQFRPLIPEGLGDRVRLSGLGYRGAELSLTVTGSGDAVRSMTVNGRDHDPLEPIAAREFAADSTVNVEAVVA